MATILVIDDEAMVRATMANMLGSAGHAVVQAENGRAGLAAASRTGFDLALVDILMPEKEGIETIMELRRDHPGVKILAMSGGGRVNSVDFLELAKKLGADATLKKPVPMKTLLATVAQLLA
jgi:DNA-binding response OmpR family regulator